MKWTLFSYLPIQLICIGIVARLIVLGVLLHRRLALRYPCLSLFLLGGAAQAAFILWCAWHARTGYYDAYRATAFVPHILWGLLAGEIFFKLAGHFPITKSTFGIGALSAAIGLSVAYWTLRGGGWQGPIGQHLGRAWVILLGALIFCVVSGAIFKFFADEFRFNANRRAYAIIGSALMLVHLYGQERARRIERSDRIVEFSMTGGTIIAAVLWGRKLRRDSDDIDSRQADPVELIKALGKFREVENEARGVDGGTPRDDG